MQEGFEREMEAGEDERQMEAGEYGAEALVRARGGAVWTLPTPPRAGHVLIRMSRRDTIGESRRDSDVTAR